MERNLTPWLTDARDAWLADASAWIANVAPGEIRNIEPVRAMPWSAVLRVEGSDETMFFKAEGLGGWHEPRILIELQDGFTDIVPRLLAYDEARSWLLMEDRGVEMHGRLTGSQQLDVLEGLLPRYAQMQQATTHLADTFIAARAPDRRMERIGDVLDHLLGGDVYGGPIPVADQLRRRIGELRPLLEGACDELAASAVPAALDHGDLHERNILVADTRATLVDWGDSCITHPFSTLFVSYDVTLTRTEYPDKRAAARRMRDVYLDAWPSGSRREFVLAVWVAHLTRAMDLMHMLNGATPEMMTDWHRYIVDFLQRWVDTSSLLDDEDELIYAIFERTPFED